MAHWANYVGSLNMPQVEQVDEYDQYIVWREHDGKRMGTPCSEDVAQANAAYYEQQGYTNVSIEKWHVKIMGEKPW